MRIEIYFQEIRETIDHSPVVQSSNITYDKRSSHDGLIRGEVYFVDGSMLHLREFVDVQTNVDRLTYVYQYMNPVHELVFRYDNTGHHKKLNLPTYPHHKHDGSESEVVASPTPDLVTVLTEIEALVELH